jgi:hypothetical protein
MNSSAAITTVANPTKVMSQRRWTGFFSGRLESVTSSVSVMDGGSTVDGCTGAAKASLSDVMKLSERGAPL